MITISDDEFQTMIDEALTELPGEHIKNIKNVAILYELEPTPEQRTSTNLHPNQTLLGLYQGVPLSQRQGTNALYPDRITLFKGPLTRQSKDEHQLKEAIKHTLWHEIAHYYGLDHSQISALE